MKPRLLFTGWLITALVGAAEGQVRKWTDKSESYSLQAEFVELTGDQVVLKNEDGKNIRVPLERLSAADQQYVRQKASSKPDNPFAAPESATPAPKPSGGTNGNDGATQDGGMLREVVATGQGATEEEAKRDAFHNAVEQVVGVYVDATTIANNDKLIEDSVLTYSNAYIKSFTVIRSSVGNGVHTIKIRATVKVQRLAEKLQSQGIKTATVDGASLAAEIVTTKRMQEDAKTLLAKTIGDFPLPFVEFVPSGTFSPNDNGGLDTTVRYRINKEAYRRHVAEMEKILKPHASEAGTGSVSLKEWGGDGQVTFAFEPVGFSAAAYQTICQALNCEWNGRKTQYVVMIGTTVAANEVTVHWYLLDRKTGHAALEAWRRACDLSLLCTLQDAQGTDIAAIVKRPYRNRNVREPSDMPGVLLCSRDDEIVTFWGTDERSEAGILILPKIIHPMDYSSGMSVSHMLLDVTEVPCHFDISVEEVARAKKLVAVPSVPSRKVVTGSKSQE